MAARLRPPQRHRDRARRTIGATRWQAILAPTDRPIWTLLPPYSRANPSRWIEGIRHEVENRVLDFGTAACHTGIGGRAPWWRRRAGRTVGGGRARPDRCGRGCSRGL